jgi:hypothetical protein
MLIRWGFESKMYNINDTAIVYYIVTIAWLLHWQVPLYDIKESHSKSLYLHAHIYSKVEQLYTNCDNYMNKDPCQESFPFWNQRFAKENVELWLTFLYKHKENSRPLKLTIYSVRLYMMRLRFMSILAGRFHIQSHFLSQTACMNPLFQAAKLLVKIQSPACSGLNPIFPRKKILV